MWPVQSALLRFTVCRIFVSCNTSSFHPRSVQLIFLQHHISHLSRYIWPTFRTVHVSAPHKLRCLKFKSNLLVKEPSSCWTFRRGNPTFNFTCRSTSCTIHYHATQTVEIFHILHCFWSTTIRTTGGCFEILIVLLSYTFFSIPQHLQTPVATVSSVNGVTLLQNTARYLRPFVRVFNTHDDVSPGYSARTYRSVSICIQYNISLYVGLTVRILTRNQIEWSLCAFRQNLRPYSGTEL